jgi:hypothetical protein
MADENGAQGGGAVEGSAKTSLPGYVKDNLGKEVYEEWSKRIEKDPEFAKQIPATLPEFAKTWDSGRSQLAEISKKLKEVEEGRKPPNSPKDYGFKKPELQEGMVYDEKLTESFAQWAHDEGLTVKAAQGLYNKFNAAEIERQKAIIEEDKKQASEMQATRSRELETARTELRKQWGETYDARMPRNMNALSNPVMVPPEIATMFDTSGLLRKPAFHLWWDRQVSMMSSDRRLGIKGEEPESTEEDNEQTVKDAAGNRHLKPGMFKNTEKRFPSRKKAS